MRKKMEQNDMSDEARTDTEAQSLESAYGSVRASAHPEDWDDVTRNANDAKAEATVWKLNQTSKS